MVPDNKGTQGRDIQTISMTAKCFLETMRWNLDICHTAVNTKHDGVKQKGARQETHYKFK